MNQACGCCKTAVEPTPAALENRPGLSAIAYRVGTFGSFRQAMVQAISGQPDLAAWTARQSEDLGISVLEMWAYLADILTFYQERSANEAFLRTAVQRDSLLRLAALLGYEPDPGVAATAYLAFTVDQAADIAAGLRVQSVPGPGEQAQKFETTEAVAARPAWNKLRAYPPPVSAGHAPLGPGSTGLTALSGAGSLAPGDRLVFYDGSRTEDRSVERVAAVDWRTEVGWSPPLNRGGTTVRKWVRKFRLFGAAAPATYLAPRAGSSSVTFELAAVSHDVSGTRICLDAVYDDIKENTELLIVNTQGSAVWTARVAQAAQTQAEVYGSVGGAATDAPLMQATVSELTLDTDLPAVDRRYVVVYELAGDAIAAWSRQYDPAGITGEYLYLPISQVQVEEGEAVSEFLPAGRLIILDDGAGEPAVVTVAAVAEEVDVDQPHLAVRVSPELARPFSGGASVLLANVAPASHGETVAGEVLGSGDPAAAFQSFALKKAPVTRVPSAAAAGGAASTLAVRVDGVEWTGVDSLYGRGPAERVFTTAADAEGRTTVRFGDGLTGSRPPRGARNITATYRQGMGSAGRVRAGVLTNALDKFVGFKSVSNPAAAAGGADPDTEETLRADAPATVRTFDRAVSLQDFADLARSVAGIAKAAATWVWDGRERMVHITVAGDDGQAVTGDPYDNLVAYLDARRDPHRPMRVETYRPLYVTVEAGVEVDPAYVADDVLAATRQALLDHFAFAARAFGQSVHVSDLYAVLEQVEGVAAAYLRRLEYKDAAEFSAHGLDPAAGPRHLPVLPARADRLNPGTVLAAELALLEDEADVTVTEGGMA